MISTGWGGRGVGPLWFPLAGESEVVVRYDFHWLARARVRARWLSAMIFHLQARARGWSAMISTGWRGRGRGRGVVRYDFHWLARVRARARWSSTMISTGWRGRGRGRGRRQGQGQGQGQGRGGGPL